jgi:hypothetical protein
VSRLDLRPGAYEIRVAATVGGRTGGVFAHVDVPDYRKERFAASGLVFGASGTVTLAGGGLMADLLPFVPTVMREFRTTDRATALLRLYQLGSKVPQAVSVDTKIVDERDQTTFSESHVIDPAEFRSTRSADYRLDLPLSDLPAGAYLLTIEASAASRRVPREARFWIVSDGTVK